MSLPPLVSTQQGYRRGPSLLFAGRNLKGLSLALGHQSSWNLPSSCSDTDTAPYNLSPCLPQLGGFAYQAKNAGMRRNMDSPRPPRLVLAIPDESPLPCLLLPLPDLRVSDTYPYTPAVSKTPFLPPPLCAEHLARTPLDRTISTPAACTIFTHGSGSDTTPLSEDPPPPRGSRAWLALGRHSPDSHHDRIARTAKADNNPHTRASPRKYSLRSALPESPHMRFAMLLMSLDLHTESPRTLSHRSPDSPTILLKSSAFTRTTSDAPPVHSPRPSSPHAQKTAVDSRQALVSGAGGESPHDPAHPSQTTTLYKNSAAPEELREANAVSAYPRGPRNVLDSLVFLYSDPDPARNMACPAVDVADYDLVINVAEECRDLSSDFPAQVAGEKQYVHYQWSHTSAIAADLLEITRLLQLFYSRGKRALVHCQCGVLRLACVIVALYMRHFGVGVNQAYELLKQGSASGDACDRICPNMSLIFELMEFGDQPQ